MSRHNKSEWYYLVPFSIIMACIALAWWVGSSAMEARAFNRATGSNVSTFDAMFVQLRVQEGVKDQ